MEMNLLLQKKKMFDTAHDQGQCIGAFNVFNSVTAEAVVKASNELKMPAIIQMSMTMVKKMGVQKATAMLKMAIAESDYGVYHHLDHCTDALIAKQCIQSGWASIMFDGSELPFEENVRVTKEILDYASDFGVMVEGEIGQIKGVEDDISVDNEVLAGYDQVKKYVERTKVHTIAPSIGTAHGLYSGSPVIDYGLIRELYRDIEQPVVIHGGSGLSVEEYHKLVMAGAAKINISTAVKHAYLDSVKKLSNAEQKYSPYDFDQAVMAHVKEVIKEFMLVFSPGVVKGEKIG